MNISDIFPELFDIIINDICMPHVEMIALKYKLNKKLVKKEIKKLKPIKYKEKDIDILCENTILFYLCFFDNVQLMIYYKYKNILKDNIDVIYILIGAYGCINLWKYYNAKYNILTWQMAKYAHKNKQSTLIKLIMTTNFKNHKEIHYQNYLCTAYAIYYKNTQLLKWIVLNKYYPITCETFNDAVRENNIKMIQWSLRHGIIYGLQSCNLAKSYNRHRILKLITQ